MPHDTSSRSVEPRVPDPGVAPPSVLAAALEQLVEGVIVTDAAGRITFVNEAAARLHGVARLDIAPEQYAATYDLLTEDGRAYPSTELPLARAVLRGETVIDARWRIRRPDGSEILAVGSARPVLGPDGTRIGAVLTVRDDTPRVDAERARDAADATTRRVAFLAMVSERFASSLDYDATIREVVGLAVPTIADWAAYTVDAGDGSVRVVAIHHSDPERAAFAREIARRYPIRADEPAGAAHVLRTGEPEVIAEIPDAVLAAVAQDEEHLRMLRAVGFRSLMTVPVVAQGRVLGALGFGTGESGRAFGPDDLAFAEELARRAAVAIDHTRLYAEAEAARDAAERSAARTALLQSLTDALSRTLAREDVAVVVADDVATAFDAHVGVLALVTPARDRLGVAMPERLPVDSWRAWETFAIDARVPLAEAARTGRPVLLPTLDAIAGFAPSIADICRDFGTEAMCAMPVLASDGQVLGALGLSFARPHALDADALTLLETVVRQAALAVERAQLFEAAEAARADAEGANRAKSQFLSTMSHELRTPLNAIAGYAELLTMGLRGALTDVQQQDVERIRRANQHLMALVNDVLNFARLDAGRIEFRLADVELAVIVADLEPLFGPQVAAKGLAFDHDGCASDTPGRPHVVRADPEKLRQVLLNLLTNAIKFTDAGGKVRLACATDAAAGVVRVTVTDTGRGIPQDQLERIFEPFVQVDRHRTHESQQGVGLGLAISRDLARGMGGDLTAASVVGEGSTFTLVLPMA